MLALITTKHQKRITYPNKDNASSIDQLVKSEQMNLIINLTAVLLVISTTGCGEKGEQGKTSDHVVLKTQLEALDKAKKVDGMLQDAAEQQRKTIEDSTISEKQ